MSERWFLKIDGIVGESTDAAHKGEIEVESWSWGISHSGGPGGPGGGGGAGKAIFSDFHFVSRISAASPPLLLACATGSRIKQATLSGARSAGKSIDYLKYKLSDVTVGSIEELDDAGAAPAEQFSLSYSKIEVSYTPQSSSGKMGAPVTFGYDVKANKKI